MAAMPALPPLDFGSTAVGGAVNQNGSSFMASGPGDWNVNLGGSGTAYQSSGSAPPVAATLAGLVSSPLLWVALALGGAWLLLPRR